MDIKINEFEGPLELLHLQLKKNKADIYSVDISVITDQFLSYIYELEKLDMNATSSFILLAADLIAIKTKLLLQTPQEDEGDPVEELAFRLEVYETFAKISEELKEMQNHDVFYRKENEYIEIPVVELDTAPSFLYQAFSNLIKRQEKVEEEIPVIPIEKESFSIKDKIIHLENILKIEKKLSFYYIIKQATSISEKVVIFLALLELIAEKKVYVEQKALDEQEKDYHTDITIFINAK